MRKISTLLGVLAITLSSVTAALAHSSVVKTIPQYQSLLQELPAEVAIQFSEEPLTLKGKAINSITVVNPDGLVISQKLTDIDGEKLIVKVDNVDAVAGTYSVKYRMASADGHVISGSYRFDLKKSSKAVTTKEVEENQWWGSHFLHLHKEHILQAIAVLLLGAAWFVVRRRRQS
ncbi:CopC domain containing protein [Candidatus Nanopelagicaceae bacterium]